MPFVRKVSVAQSAFCSTTAPCAAVASIPAIPIAIQTVNFLILHSSLV